MNVESKMKIRHILIIPVIILFFVSVGLFCSSDKIEEPVEKVTPVKVNPVATDQTSIPIYSSGALASQQQIRLSFKTGGIVEKINVREGQSVRNGAVLAELELDEIEAQVEQAKSGFDKAQRDYERTKNLHEDGVATLEQKQNVETQLNVATSTLRIAEYNLDHSIIKAPADGRVLKQLVETNEIVGPGHPVFYFGSGREKWIVRVGVADREVINLRIGDPAEITFTAYPEILFPGTVSEIAQAADPMTGDFEVEITLDAGGRRLAVGFFAQAKVIPSVTSMRTFVPVSALVDANGSSAFVYTVSADSATKMPVVLGAIVGDKVEIVSDLDDSFQVVTDGANYLKVGDKVQILN
jgi:membrane fusion protein, multidrug efflux system